MNWDQYYISMAFLTAMKSKDASSKCGAVLVGQSNEVLSIGFNGFPRNILEKPERNERPAKYDYTEHAERNAIYNAARIGAKTIGSRMYVTGAPCTDCARAIIQSGVWTVIVSDLWDKTGHDGWSASTKTAREMITEAGIAYNLYTGEIVSELQGFINGKVLKL